MFFSEIMQPCLILSYLTLLNQNDKTSMTFLLLSMFFLFQHIYMSIVAGNDD